MNVIQHYNIDLILDIGANRGQFALTLRKEGYQGEIHSFEPVRDTFIHLQHTSETDKDWNCHQLAMSSSHGVAEINVSEVSELSSFLDLNKFGKSRFYDGQIKSETVQMETIDRYIIKNIKNYHERKILLKMDTQGHDLEVFNGSINSLESIKCILSEISMLPIYSKMPNYTESLDLFKKHGFSISGMYPVSRKEDFSIVEFDCCLVKPEQ